MIKQVVIFGTVIVGGILLGPIAAVSFRAAADEAAFYYQRTWSANRKIDRYLSHHSPRKLHLGAGSNNLEGWLNTDIEPLPGQAHLDAAGRYPMPDRSFDYVFSEHLIEHLTLAQGASMLRESYRVLAPGGKVRIATPNLLTFVRLFDNAKAKDARHYMSTKLRWHGWPSEGTPECIILNFQLRSFGHQFVYDPDTLRSAIEQAGFRAVRQVAIGESDDVELRGVESRHKHPNVDIRNANGFETMVWEAVRP